MFEYDLRPLLGILKYSDANADHHYHYNYQIPPSALSGRLQVYIYHLFHLLLLSLSTQQTCDLSKSLKSRTSRTHVTQGALKSALQGRHVLHVNQKYDAITAYVGLSLCLVFM